MSHQSLFVSAFVFLLAACISVPLAKRLGLSSVLGYLVAGIVIGPFGLHLVGEEGQDVMHFAEFGVVMMLFLVGLELQPSLLWRLRGPVLGLGGAQVLLTVALVSAVAMAFGLAWQMALAVGMALTLSSTAIVLQYLQEKGLSGSSGGRGAFSVLLAQDIAVIPMLALMPMLATLAPAAASGGHGEDHGGDHGAGHTAALQEWIAHQPAWVNTLLVLAAVAAIIVAGRFLFRPVFRAVAKTGVREAFVALALLIVIGIALLMTTLGVSAALGTFLAGVVLADSEYRHELESDIEPFKGLLLGVFFIAVGASIDFSLIAAQPLVVAGIVAGIVVLKAGVLFGLGSVARLGVDQRVLFSLSLAQGSEFSFVLLGFALSAGVLGGPLVQLLVAAVALSMALTPLILLVEEKLLRPRIGTREAGEGRPDDEMDEAAPVILVGVGRFGNFVARMLRAQKVDVTVIDSDSDHVEFLRKLGIKTFYGDASRYDLLEAAGAGRARLIVLAVDEEEKLNAMVATVRKHFPDLKIMARALSRNHEYQLIDDGVDYSIHQHVGSSLKLSEAILVRLGYRAHHAARSARTFFKHDRESVRQTASLYKDQSAYISAVRERISDLEREFESAQSPDLSESDKAWDPSKLREDTASGSYGDIVPGGERPER